MNKIADALKDLARITDPARAARANTVQVTNLHLDVTGASVTGCTAVTGDAGYCTRIKFWPRRAVSCTCPDATQRKVACKHVAALASKLADLVN